MSDIYTGSCLCGDVSYQITGPLRPIIACHCNQCRKTSGNFVTATQVSLDQLSLTNKDGLNWYASSQSARRGFCAHCGSNLFWQRNDEPKISIMAGTLDGPTGLKIDRHIFTEFAGDYYHVTEAE